MLDCIWEGVFEFCCFFENCCCAGDATGVFAAGVGEGDTEEVEYEGRGLRGKVALVEHKLN